MPVWVDLKRVRDNPYQPRQEYADVAELAEKILALQEELPETLGLIHPPNARLVGGDGQAMHFAGTLPAEDEEWFVQIAEGHRRKRAFQVLAERGLAGYERMPVTVLDLDEQAMDDVAWSENEDRKELSPVEKARSLKRSMEQFGMSQAALAERRKMDAATVSNKLRLLKLPEDLLEAIHAGVISERVGMAYLPALEIKEADLKTTSGKLNRDAKFQTWQTPHPDTLRGRLATQGDLTADQVREIISRIQRTVEQAKKEKWEKDKTKDEGRRTEGSPASGAPTSRALPGVARDAPTGARPGPVMRPVETGGEPQKLEMSPITEEPPALDLADVVVTIRFARGKAARPKRFTLSAGEDGTFPQFFSGQYPEELGTILEHACSLFFPADGTPGGEQILMEMEVSHE